MAMEHQQTQLYPQQQFYPTSYQAPPYTHTDHQQDAYYRALYES